MALTTATLVIKYADITGAPLVGERIRFSPSAESVIYADEDTIVPDVDRVVTLDAQGTATTTLVVGGNPEGWTYHVTELFGNKREYDIPLTEGTHQLSDLVPVPSHGGTAIVVGPAGPQGPPGESSAGGFDPTITTFTEPGSHTYEVPAGATMLTVYAVGGGGGGAGGSRYPASTAHRGGNGGSGAAATVRDVLVSDLPPGPLTVTVGAGASGGAAADSDSSNGSNGASGGWTGVGTFVLARGGNTSTAGSTSSAGGAAGASGMYGGSSGGSSSLTAAASDGTVAVTAGGGGGAGGGISAAGVALAAGDGGNSQSDARTAAAVGQPGLPANGFPQGGLGGGGGNSSIDGPGMDGGAGGWPGGGGGGGGASVNGQPAGRGGDGGGGVVHIYAR